ncbi:MAG: Uma2 family endonuclease [Gemmataceae bacterium]|nr:Uma2 family endonuclease [Gemmataceae bacterium]
MMTTLEAPAPPRSEIVYPSSDGKRMAENTKQLRWIVLLLTNIELLLAHLADVLVAADLLWYPVEGEPGISTAPDILVALGRPRGDRLSYLQWKEGDKPPQVVFEILSPSNGYKEMADKLAFYDEHGVEEYYVYDPDRDTLSPYKRGRAALVLQEVKGGVYVSPLLGLRFDLTGDEMTVHHPDGQRFLTVHELQERRLAAEKAQAAAEKAQADTAQRMARLRDLSRRVRGGLASPEEIAELDRLEAEG